jgi:hypothetical protein
MITICAAFFMQRVCLDRQRRNPLIDLEDPVTDPPSQRGQTQRISKAANFDKFFDSNRFTYFN